MIFTSESRCRLISPLFGMNPINAPWNNNIHCKNVLMFYEIYCKHSSDFDRLASIKKRKIRNRLQINGMLKTSFTLNLLTICQCRTALRFIEGSLNPKQYPTGTWHNNNIIMTSKRRRDLVCPQINGEAWSIIYVKPSNYLSMSHGVVFFSEASLNPKE